MVEKWTEIQNDEFLMFHLYKDHCDKFWQNGCPEIARYMGVQPFHDCVMINISPNWKGKFGESDLIDKLMIKKFKIVIDNYLKSCDRWSKWKYVLECKSSPWGSRTIYDLWVRAFVERSRVCPKLFIGNCLKPYTYKSSHMYYL